MNVYDLAYNLVRGLKETQEYQKYQEALSKIKGNKEKEELLADFRKKQMEIQAMQLMGQEVPKEKTEELHKIMGILSYHPVIKEYLEAEFRLSRVLADIQKIIAQGVELWYPEMK
ncbi:MAG: YlbF family regulator [Clostridia bacterium]|nr:YlbF family regulator [Clostridia bacterium]